MSMQLHIYADDESAEILISDRAKALMIGSDFGYGNFGDVLQHIGAASRIRSCTPFAIASVLSVDAIARLVDAATLRKSYGVDALAFVSTAPLVPEKARELGLKKIRVLRNVACIQLYGGGFLNENWGDFVLGVAEYFLSHLPGALYLVSGQQVSPGYAGRVSRHVAKYKPRLVGARDRDTLSTLSAEKVRAQYSFDDAVEPLRALAKTIQVNPGANSAYLHLNSSDYTGNDAQLEEMKRHLQLISGAMGGGKLVLLQAFQDAREEVVDSIETVKRLETSFPFSDAEAVLLVAALLGGDSAPKPLQLTGRFGYSCSYHVTLWLQLNGIPCWLRGSNDYYGHKRRSLGIEGDFRSFLETLPKPDHGENLQQRDQWSRRLNEALGDAKVVVNKIEWSRDAATESARVFNYKGEPRLQARLDETWAALCYVREENSRINTELGQVQEARALAEDQLQAAAVEQQHAISAEYDVLQLQLKESDAKREAVLEMLHRTQGERDAIHAKLGEVDAERQALIGQLKAMLSEQTAVQARLQEQVTNNASLLSQLLDATAQVAELKATVKQGEDAAALQEVQLQDALSSTKKLERELDATKRNETQLVGRINVLSRQVTTVGAECRDLKDKLQLTEAGWYSACRGNEQLSANIAALADEKQLLEQELKSARAAFTTESERLEHDLQVALAHLAAEKFRTGQELQAAESRLMAYSAQIAEVGNDARAYREQSEWANASLMVVSDRERVLAERVQLMTASRSWRWTMPVRALGRYIRTGRFDSLGNVGLFEMLRIVGRKAPMPSTWRSALGRGLEKLRRR